MAKLTAYNVAIAMIVTTGTVCSLLHPPKSGSHPVLFIVVIVAVSTASAPTNGGPQFGYGFGFGVFITSIGQPGFYKDFNLDRESCNVGYSTQELTVK